MDWTDKIWKTASWVASTSAGAAASALNVVGSWACAAGGAGFAASFSMAGTVKEGYAAWGNAAGAVNIGFEVPSYNYGINRTIPLHFDVYKHGGATYDFNQYVKPESVQSISTILILSGILLRVMGANLAQFQQGVSENKEFKQRQGHEVRYPQFEEYVHASSDSLLGSLTFVLMSSALTNTLINCSGLMGAEKSFTKPAASNSTVNDTYYQGPVENIIKTVGYKTEQDFNVTIPGVNLTLNVTAIFDALGVINATYGGGIFFKSDSTPDAPIAGPAIAGAAAWLASNFFAKKLKKVHDDRVYGDGAVLIL